MFILKNNKKRRRSEQIYSWRPWHLRRRCHVTCRWYRRSHLRGPGKEDSGNHLMTSGTQHLSNSLVWPVDFFWHFIRKKCVVLLWSCPISSETSGQTRFFMLTAPVKQLFHTWNQLHTASRHAWTRSCRQSTVQILWSPWTWTSNFYETSWSWKSELWPRSFDFWSVAVTSGPNAFAVPGSRCGSFSLLGSVRQLDSSPAGSWRSSLHQELLLGWTGSQSIYPDVCTHVTTTVY